MEVWGDYLYYRFWSDTCRSQSSEPWLLLETLNAYFRHKKTFPEIMGRSVAAELYLLTM
jgi:hypothetical protein